MKYTVISYKFNAEFLASTAAFFAINLWALKCIRFKIFWKFTQYLKIIVFYTDRADARQSVW